MPCISFITPLLSNALTVFTLVLGSLFLAAPSTILDILVGDHDDYNDGSGDDDGGGGNDHDNIIVIHVLTKLVGGVLIAYTINTQMHILFMSMFRGSGAGAGAGAADENSVSSSTPVAVTASKQTHDKHRMTLISNSILGFVILLLGLLQYANVGVSDGNGDGDGGIQIQIQKMSMMFVAVGSSILILGCIGLMTSFYPFDTDLDSDLDNDMTSRVQNRSENNNNGPSVSGAENRNGNGNRNRNRPDNTIPLLEESQQSSQLQDIETPSVQEQQEQHPDANVDADTNTETETITETETESRIKGTKRLIKLAGPHTFYLYVGCIVLLIRLPFSLSIPHFVSETQGALARANYTEAKRNICLLFALGTVDAALDFWCVFLFGLTNLKITKGVRIDTYSAILRQDVAFFDCFANSSGELSSRLNSDCGEIGGDLTWFFRFSIESVVRIVSIVTYMLWRSPQLGACAISVVSSVQCSLCTKTHQKQCALYFYLHAPIVVLLVLGSITQSRHSRCQLSLR